MKQFLQKLFSPGVRARTITVLILVLAAAGVSAGVQIQRAIIRSRTVTQATISEGWKAAGLELIEHRISHRENFWKVARMYSVDIDAIVGANHGLGKLNASLNQTIRVPNRRGVVHRTEDGERAETIAELYRVPLETITSLNNLGPKHILMPGLELFIPGAKPVKLTEEMMAQYGLRGIFGSPLPGRITSGMGLRTHPVGGFRGRHTGVDLAANDGTSIAAAASGTVIQTGAGEYIGNFVILAHQDGYTTIYGHCSQVLAAAGRTVKKGQIIAKSGHTGRVTGPHLHFEIRKNGVPQNPLAYLW